MMGIRIRRSHRWEPWLVGASLAPLIVMYLAFMGLPIAWTVIRSFAAPQGTGLGNYLEMARSPFLLQSFGNSIWVSAWSAAIGTALALPSAMAIRRSPKREAFTVFCNTVNNFSGVPLAFAFIVIMGTQGAITILLRRHLGLELDIYSSTGLMILYVYFQVPLGILSIYPALDVLGRDLLEASRTLGASDGRFWLKVGFPLLLPTVSGTGCLLFANAMGAYATAYALNTNSNLVPIRISSLVAGDVFLDFDLACAMSTALLAITLSVTFLGMRARVRSQGSSPGGNLLDISNPRWSAPVLLGTLAFLLLPVLSTVLHSLSSSWGATVLPDGLSSRWYRELIGDPRFRWAVLRSVGVSALSVGLASAVLLPPMVLSRCFYPRLYRGIERASIVPLVVPPVVTSVGLLILYSPTPIGGTIWLLTPVYSVMCVPFVARGISSALEGMNLREIMEAALSFGMGPLKALVQVVLPNIKGGLASGALMGFSVLMGEFVLGNLLVGTRFETLQIYLFSKRGAGGHLASAMVTVHFLVCGTLSAMAWWSLKGSRSGIRDREIESAGCGGKVRQLIRRWRHAAY